MKTKHKKDPSPKQQYYIYNKVSARMTPVRSLSAGLTKLLSTKINKLELRHVSDGLLASTNRGSIKLFCERLHV